MLPRKEFLPGSPLAVRVLGFIGLFLIIPVGTFLVVRAIHILPLLLEKPYLDLCARAGFRPKRLAGLAFMALIGGLGSILAWTALVSLIRQREQLRRASGKNYADNEWGFGQVTAVMTWISAVQDVIFATLRAFISRRLYSIAHPGLTLYFFV